MDTLRTMRPTDLRLGDVVLIGMDKFATVTALELTYRGEVRFTYVEGTGDATRVDVETMLQNDVVWVRDPRVSA